jgi:hypothetical protein
MYPGSGLDLSTPVESVIWRVQYVDVKFNGWQMTFEWVSITF